MLGDVLDEWQNASTSDGQMDQQYWKDYQALKVGKDYRPREWGLLEEQDFYQALNELALGIVAEYEELIAPKSKIIPLHVFPNPAVDIVNINGFDLWLEMEGALQTANFALVDVSWNQISHNLDFSGLNKGQLDVSSLVSWVYFLSRVVPEKNKKYSAKIVVKK